MGVNDSIWMDVGVVMSDTRHQIERVSKLQKMSMEGGKNPKKLRLALQDAERKAGDIQRSLHQLDTQKATLRELREELEEGIRLLNNELNEQLKVKYQEALKQDGLIPQSMNLVQFAKVYKRAFDEAGEAKHYDDVKKRFKSYAELF
jgi:hypothetical protein